MKRKFLWGFEGFFDHKPLFFAGGNFFNQTMFVQINIVWCKFLSDFLAFLFPTKCCAYSF